MWETLYNLLVSVIGSGATYEWGDITCQILATVGCVFICVLPFVVVWCAIRFFVGLIGK